MCMLNNAVLILQLRTLKTYWGVGKQLQLRPFYIREKRLLYPLERKRITACMNVMYDGYLGGKSICSLNLGFK